MSESPKFSDKAADLAAQAAAAAGPLKEKASELAAQAAAAAGPMAAQARERATELATQAVASAGPLAAQARERAAQGVEVLAENLDKITGGKYTDRIGSLSAKLEDALATSHSDKVGPVAEPTHFPTDAAEPPERGGPIP
ncbi:MAG: hypothetical protein M3070_00530 [Actinomycetota bacterium]|nr:hypothetical protein [Actinomycetota bacterium]